MITKKLFCMIIKLMREQDTIDSEVSAALSRIGDGHFNLNTENKKYRALEILLREELNDNSDYLSWFLYEDVDKKVWLKDGTEVDVSTPEKLYDFLTTP